MIEGAGVGAGSVPVPYLILMDLDPGGQKTYGFGSATMIFSILFMKIDNILAKSFLPEPDP
jgi:hypothetical protein